MSEWRTSRMAVAPASRTPPPARRATPAVVRRCVRGTRAAEEVERRWRELGLRRWLRGGALAGSRGGGGRSGGGTVEGGFDRALCPFRERRRAWNGAAPDPVAVISCAPGSTTIGVPIAFGWMASPSIFTTASAGACGESVTTRCATRLLKRFDLVARGARDARALGVDRACDRGRGVGRERSPELPERLEAGRDPVPHGLRVSNGLDPLELLEGDGVAPGVLVGQRLGEELAPRRGELRLGLRPGGGYRHEALRVRSPPPESAAKADELKANATARIRRTRNSSRTITLPAAGPPRQVADTPGDFTPRRGASCFAYDGPDAWERTRRHGVGPRRTRA